jgi:hypothetical protein
LAGVLGLAGKDRERRTQIEVNLVRHREPPRQMRFARKAGKVEVNYFTPAQRTSRNFQRSMTLSRTAIRPLRVGAKNLMQIRQQAIVIEY